MVKVILGIVTLLLVLGVSLGFYSRILADKPAQHGQNSDGNNDHLFDPGNELSKSKCTTATGDPIIEVSQKVQNDADSGVAGNYWAFDYYSRHITLWKTTTVNTYCGIVTYDGNFYAVPGQISPQNIPVSSLINTSTDEPVNGSFTGGRRVTITGSLLGTSLWPTHGSVGTTNYQCNITGTCPGIISWPSQYFTAGYTYNDDWWGWKYNGGSHGTWINAINGNSGNIL